MRTRFTASTSALLYAAAAALWIVASGTLLDFAVSDPLTQSRVELFKGLAFVVVTSAMLYLLLRTSEPDPVEDPPQRTSRGRGSLLTLMLVMVASVPLIGIGVYTLQAREGEQGAFADLTANARLKSEQIESWLAERRGDANALAASIGFVERVVKFRLTQDAHEREVIRNRLEALIQRFGYDAVSLLDATGRPLLGYGNDHILPKETRDLFAGALADGQVRIGPLLRDAQNELHLDVVAPLRQPTAGGHEPVGLVVLHVSPQRFLFPTIQTWPSASESGEFLLARRDGDSVLYLNELRHRSGTAMSLREPPSNATLPAAAAVNAQQPGTLRGRDYRGVPVLAAWWPIAGTDWRLVAKLDRAEALSGARDTALWVGLFALLAVILLAIALAAFWRAQRRADQAASQIESDRRFKLFFDLPFVGMAITSPETKRWVRFNDELCGILGYSREELGHLSWAEMTHPEDLDKDVAEFDQVVRGESEGYAMEKRFVRKDGDIVHATIDVKCRRKPDGAVEFFVATIQDITQRTLAELTLRESESRLRRAIESAPIPIMLHAEHGEVMMISQAWTEITGYTLADIPTTAAWTERAYGERRQLVQADIDRLYGATKAVKEGEYTIRTRDGESRVWSFMSVGLGSTSEAGRLAISMAMDVTDSEIAHERIEALVRMYATLSKCNEAIVRCEDEQALFAQVCAAAVEQGGMKLAWVGVVDDKGQIMPSAHAGEGHAYLDGIVISLDEGEPTGQGPTGTAIRENLPYWCQDFRNDPRTAAWHERGAQYGWGSTAALPLRRNGAVVGALTIYSERVAMFDEATQGLLMEIAAGISFALDNFDREARRKKAEATLLDQYDELRSWYRAMRGREERTLKLKGEVNDLLKQAGLPPRYASAEDDGAAGLPHGNPPTKAGQ